MAGFEGRDAGIQEAAGKTQVSQQVQQFVPAAFVRKMQLEVVQIAFFGDD